MARMPYFVVTFGFLQTSSFTTLNLPFISLATASSAGAMALHGPHHSAKKSTSTGSDDLSTSCSKVASETRCVAPPLGMGPVSLGLPREGTGWRRAHGGGESLTGT